MINPKTKERELCYVTYIDRIEEIPGRDFTECAVIGGWKTLVRKNLFKPGDIGIYIEIDSQTPETPPFDFLAKYHFKIKTQKFKTFYSQGLLMHPSDFGWKINEIFFTDNEKPFIRDNNDVKHCVDDESRFLTKQLGITYAVADDNKRKAPSVDKYKKMAQRHPNIFKKKWARWMMNRKWGKEIMFFFFGKRKDKNGGWPSWVKKTDEERCQNMPWLFTDKDWHDTEWFATEKIDGTSTTFTIRRGKLFHKPEFYVCSRNVCFDTPERINKCFYESNVYIEMAIKYNIQNVLEMLLKKNPNLDFVTIQGETYGDGIQKRTYSVPNGYHAFMAFNLIYGYKNGRTVRLNPREMTDTLASYGVPCVPIISELYKLPMDCDTLLLQATGESALDHEMREGIVFRDRRGERSFKAVSNEFLARFHS